MKKRKLGEVLRERGQISLTELAQAVADQQGKVVMLGEMLLARGIVNKGQLVSALEEVTHIPYVDCTGVTPDPALLRKVPVHLARKCLALPIGQENSRVVMVMAEPQNLAVLDELKFTIGGNISPRMGFREEILQAIAASYPGESAEAATPPSAAEADQAVVAQAEVAQAEVDDMEFISTSTRQANREAIEEAQAELVRGSTPAVRIVSEIIRDANLKRASDIHIEPQATEVVVRIRVDGMLRDLRREPRVIQNTLISRIKILADMDIAERRTPQDGRFMVRIGAQSIDMRVSTLPTQYGEKVVMRLLNSDSGVVNFAELGMPAAIEETFREVLSLPQGMLLVTGPTGSGKSTTLRAALSIVRKPTLNVVTVEDPVEYVIPGINQVQVNKKAGFTFATCLRSILRQDPNVIMIGEIRDKETAEIALKASQTGHLVLSTLHTNDALSAVTRLLDLGIPPFMVAASVTAIIAQRLVRRLCHCRQQVRVSEEAREKLGTMGKVEGIDSMFIPTGCADCDHTGYQGRVGVYEMLSFDDFVREAVRNGSNSDVIRGVLRDLGIRLMQEDALDKIQQGITSLEEVARVVPVQTFSPAECPGCRRQVVPSFHFCPHCGAPQAAAKGDQRKSSAKSARKSQEKSPPVTVPDEETVVP